MTRTLILLLLVFAGSVSAQDLTITGGRYFDTNSGSLVNNPGIHVRAGRIVQIGGDRDSTGIPDLELSGEDVLLPGLVDLHAHYKIFIDGNRRDETVANPVIYLANGVTTTFTAGEESTCNSFEAPPSSR